MKYYVGLDVSTQETSVCIVDDRGGVAAEKSVPTDPEDIAAYLASTGFTYERVGLEAGPCSPWLFQALDSVDLPVVCIDARHASAALKAQQVKTDKNDARGLAQIMRTGWYRTSHVKSGESQRMRVLLNTRKTLLRQRIEIDNQIRGTLKVFGLKVGPVAPRAFESRVRTLLTMHEELRHSLEPLLTIRRHLLDECRQLDSKIRSLVKEDEVCQRLMTIPGVGQLTALLFKCTIDDPHRFKKSTNVGVHLGLTPRKYASGDVDYNGRITKCGDVQMRAHLYEAAQALMRRTAKKTSLKEWGHRLAKRSSRKNAHVAVARKIAVMMHRIWIDGTVFHDKALAATA